MKQLLVTIINPNTVIIDIVLNFLPNDEAPVFHRSSLSLSASSILFSLLMFCSSFVITVYFVLTQSRMKKEMVEGEKREDKKK